MHLLTSAGSILIIIALLAIIVKLGYVKAPPDMAYIISGFRKPRILIGKAGIRIPFFERLDKLSLKMISVDVKTTDFVPNAEYINVKVDATVKIRVSQSEEGMMIASRHFLNENEDTIINRVQDTLEGNMREIIGQMRLSEMVTNRKAFGEKVQENAVPDLAKMGLELMAFNVQSFSDSKGVIDNLGVDNVATIQKNAQIAKAEAERDVAIASAEAAQVANDAKVKADLEIARRQNELAIRQAELKREADMKQAEADAAYSIQEQEQRKSIEIASTNADIAKAEREAELKSKEVDVAKQSLDAEIRATADAERYRQEQEAEAELFKLKKAAEAKRYEQEQEAEAVRKRAEAAKFAKEQEAAGITAVGEAEAKAIEAKALAEAAGIDKKAEAMKKYGEAAVVEMIMNALPEIAKNVAQPLSKVDKITMYGEGNSAKLLGDIVNGTNQVAKGITEGMGIDIQALIAGLIGGKIGSSTNEQNTDKVIVVPASDVSKPATPEQSIHGGQSFES